jgi:hypothetical protein
VQSTPVLKSDAPHESVGPAIQHYEPVTHRESTGASGTEPAVTHTDISAPQREYTASRSTAGDTGSTQPAIEAKPQPRSTESLPAFESSASQPAGIIPLARPLQRAAGRVAAGMDPVLDQAYGVTRQSLEAGQKPATESADSAPVGRVNNTFNVNVSMSNDQGLTAEQREALKDALMDILHSAARRHGLEV